MAGPSVEGIFSIPNEYNLRQSDTEGKWPGKWLNFKVYYSDQDYNGKNFYHMFSMSMWVPSDKVEAYLDMIKPGRFFKVLAFLDARVREDGTEPYPQLRVEYKFFRPTKIGKIE